jgi:predicted enzyme related to lactoylglutathione lyase
MSDRRVLQPGQLAYLQIPAPDVSASARFYEAVFGWSVDPPHPSFEAPGLIGQFSDARTAAPDGGLLMWLHVDDINTALDRAQANGGEVVDPPSVDGPRLLAVARDPAGNPIGLAQHGTSQDRRSE